MPNRETTSICLMIFIITSLRPVGVRLNFILKKSNYTNASDDTCESGQSLTLQSGQNIKRSGGANASKSIDRHSVMD